MYYINYFFIISVLGHLIETLFYTNSESGILFGYWTPIYGIGTIIILLLNKLLVEKQKNKILRIIIFFLCSSIILSILEATGGYLIKWIFNKELWNYSNHNFNIGKYTSLEMAFFWGITSIFFIYFIKPIVDKIIPKIPRLISYILIFLFIIDLFITIILKK